MTFDPCVLNRHVIVQDVRPTVDGGRWPVKREIGDHLSLSAEIFKEGHGAIKAVLRARPSPDAAWREYPMSLTNAGMDRWEASVPLDRLGRWQFTVVAWEDTFESWARDVAKKIEARQDIGLELIEGRALFDRLAESIAIAGKEADAMLAKSLSVRLGEAKSDPSRADVFLSNEMAGMMARWTDRSRAVESEPPLEVIVEPFHARFAAWYTMFPRSQGSDPNRSGTFDDCIARLPDIADMGFDILYLTPIHPIGERFRKGRNNTFPAQPDEPGSPYAIGSGEGGHTAIHPDLGSVEDFRRLVAAAENHGMKVALDIAIQCSQDHPWVRDHPEWFQFRPDGSIRYAENPPKKYQDIVNVDFWCERGEELWNAILDVFLYWCDQGVTVFRVDNPHTKPVTFWEWLIREVKSRYPESVFLAEAFTRPPMLKMLAKVGFSQSYTYFTWRNLKPELTDYLNDLVGSDASEYLRPNFFTSTPDILPDFLQRGGRPAFMIREVLASTLSSVYGIYNGFELCENAALPGKEEYLDSEKYQFKVRNWEQSGNIKPLIRTLNRIRRENPALHELKNLRFHDADDENVLFYSKVSFDGASRIFVAVNLDPFETHSACLDFPLERVGIVEDGTFAAEDLLSGTRKLWRGRHHTVTLDPNNNPAVIFRITPWKSVTYRDPYY